MKTKLALICAMLLSFSNTFAAALNGPGWKRVSFTTVEDQTTTVELAGTSGIELQIETADCHIKQTLDLGAIADLSEVALLSDTSQNGEKYYVFFVGVIEVDPDDDEVQRHAKRYFEVRDCQVKFIRSIVTDQLPGTE